MTIRKLTKQDYEQALHNAVDMINMSDESLGIRSAIKQCGSDVGIPWGDEMGRFVLWCEKEMGL
tara:strand:- start:243 stop:434 length:192 start_codon:yes stop_codon:yes gene_type:complete